MDFESIRGPSALHGMESAVVLTSNTNQLGGRLNECKVGLREKGEEEQKRLDVCFYQEKSNWAGDFRHYSIATSDVLPVGVLTIFSV